MHKLLVINLGSTSTRVAYYEDDTCCASEDLDIPLEEVEAAGSIFGQYDFRLKSIEDFINRSGIRLSDIDAVVSRGGLTQALEAGTFRIDEAMLAQAESGDYGMHPCNLGLHIAYDLASAADAIPMTVDTPVVCQMIPEALYSGLQGVLRKPASQPLNMRAMARAYACSQGKAFEDMRLVVANLGGGITVAALKDGRIIDTQDGAAGDGPFCTNRCNGVPVRALVDMCYSGQYTHDEILSLLYSGSGLKGYVGEVDVRKIEEEIEKGSERHREVLSAMCYQVAKEIGGLATALEGKVDAIILTGNLAKSPFVSSYLEDKVSFIAPVVHMPGQMEIEALAQGALRVLQGSEKLIDFKDGIVDIEGLLA